MIITLKRPHRLIENATVVKSDIVYANTIGYHELIVQGGVYDGEMLFVTFFRSFGGQAKAISEPLPLMPRLTTINDNNVYEYYITLPNQVVSQDGTIFCAIAIAESISGKMRQVTSGNISFEVLPSVADQDYNVIDATFATVLQDEINNQEMRLDTIERIGQAPDITLANEVGVPNVELMEDGRLKFSYLKGDPAEIPPEEIAKITEALTIANESGNKSDSAVQVSTQAATDSKKANENAVLALSKSSTAETNSVNAVETAELVRAEFNQVVEDKIAISQDINSTDTVTAPSSAVVRQALADLTQTITPVIQSAETIHLSGTSTGFVDRLIMSSEPVQVVSANLFNPKLYGQTLNGNQITFTHNLDGSVLVNGSTGEGNAFVYVSESMFAQMKFSLIPNKRYFVRLWKNNVKVTTAGEEYASVTIKYDDNSTQPINSYMVSGAVARPGNIIGYSGYHVVIPPNRSYPSTATYSYDIVENDSLPYQPYTGQPSPDNPIPIDVVSSPVEIMSRSSNLFDGQLLQGGYSAGDGLFFNTTGYVCSKNKIEIRENKIYTVSFVSNIERSVMILFYDKNGAFLSGVDKWSNNFYITFTIPVNSKYIYFQFYRGSDPQITINDVSNVMLNSGTTAQPYTTYNSAATSLPLLTAATESTPSETVELLGEYNTNSNILAQKYTKIILDETINISFIFSPNVYTRRITIPVLLKPMYKNTVTLPNIYCNKLPRKSAHNWSNYDEPSISISDPGNVGAIVLRIPVSWGTTSAEIKSYLAANPLTVYYQLATPEVLTMTPLTTEQTPKTLDGETNIFATNNASPITFDVTELLVGEKRTDAVLKDKDGDSLMVFTTANQVEVDKVTGITLDRELEAIEASVSETSIALAAETTARTQADTTLTTSINTVSNDLACVNESIMTELAANKLFDIVIRTQEQFEQMYSSPTWLDAKSVAIVGDGGSLTFTRNDNMGLLIPQTVKQIQGFNSAKIEVSKFVDDEITNKAALWYEVLPTSTDYTIRDLIVSGAGIMTIVGFMNCTQLTNCTGSGKTTGMNAVGFGFSNCTKLVNCSATGHGMGFGLGHGFLNCSQLINCTGNGRCSGGKGYGFYNVSYCSCCKAGEESSTAVAGGTNTKIDANTCDFTNS